MNICLQCVRQCEIGTTFKAHQKTWKSMFGMNWKLIKHCPIWSTVEKLPNYLLCCAVHIWNECVPTPTVAIATVNRIDDSIILRINRFIALHENRVAMCSKYHCIRIDFILVRCFFFFFFHHHPSQHSDEAWEETVRSYLADISLHQFICTRKSLFPVWWWFSVCHIGWNWNGGRCCRGWTMGMAGRGQSFVMHRADYSQLWYPVCVMANDLAIRIRCLSPIFADIFSSSDGNVRIYTLSLLNGSLENIDPWAIVYFVWYLRIHNLRVYKRNMDMYNTYEYIHALCIKYIGMNSIADYLHNAQYFVSLYLHICIFIRVCLLHAMDPKWNIYERAIRFIINCDACSFFSEETSTSIE